MRVPGVNFINFCIYLIHRLHPVQANPPSSTPLAQKETYKVFQDEKETSSELVMNIKDTSERDYYRSLSVAQSTCATP
jgi:hypothetical protein